MSATAPAALRGLFEGLIDYAGLFPPASLALPSVVDRFASYRQGPFGWVLGRLVIPVRQLEEFAACRPWREGPEADPWAIATLGGANAADDLPRVVGFNAQWHPVAHVDAFEARVETPEHVRQFAAQCASGVRLVCEVPQATGIGGILDVIAEVGAVAKLRAGGVVATAIPSTRDLAGFLLETARRRVPIKATAGLHHAVRGEYRLTYEPGAPRALMHGFLNLLWGAAWVQARALPAPEGPGVPDLDVPDALLALLERRDAPEGRADGPRMRWGDDAFEAAALIDARSSSVIAIGSCSFEEPVAELQRLGLL